MNSRFSLFTGITLAVVLGACERPTEPATQTVTTSRMSMAPPSATPTEMSAHRSPVTVKLLGPQQAVVGQDLALTAEIEQHVGSNPVQLELQLPTGARLVSGNQTELLPPGDGSVVRQFVVHLDSVPDRDLEAVAGVDRRSFGAHARGAYRFGRPEPRFAEPLRGKPLTLNGRNLGTPIQLRPKTDQP